MYTNLQRFAHRFAALGIVAAIFAGTAYAEVAPGDQITGANNRLSTFTEMRVSP